MAALLEGPAHGYELMQRLEERTGGRWRPSPGSVYPLLQMLEDQGLAKASEEAGRKVYELTEVGREQADPNLLASVAADPSTPSPHRELRGELEKLHSAARQVATAGVPEQVERAVTVVRDARQALYRLLAEE